MGKACAPEGPAQACATAPMLRQGRGLSGDMGHVATVGCQVTYGTCGHSGRSRGSLRTSVSVHVALKEDN